MGTESGTHDLAHRTTEPIASGARAHTCAEVSEASRSVPNERSRWVLRPY
jgi:hypothetical protein